MANLFDQLTFNTLRNNQLLNDQNNSGLAGYQNYDGAQEYNPNFGQSFAGIGRFDPSNMMLPSNLSQDLGASNYQDLGNSTVIDESKILHKNKQLTMLLQEEDLLGQVKGQ
mgnify:CR=1 FL=1